jgi:hypothetical protein
MARCASDDCRRWRPELLARHMAGVNVDGRWFCSQECVERMARRRLRDVRPGAHGLPGVPPPRIGALLQHFGVVNADQLHRALEAQRESRLRLGDQIQKLGFADAGAVLRALAAQAGVRYLTTIDLKTVRSAPGGLAADAVRALGLVPFSEPDEKGQIKVACTAPVPRTALTALTQLTGWTAEPYLVADEDWAELVAAYGAAAARRGPTRPDARFLRTSTLSEAAARIASAAAMARQTNITSARWEPYTWVRVQGNGLTEDILFAHASKEQPECQADITSH